MSRLPSPLYRKAIGFLARELHPDVPAHLSLAARLAAFVWDRPMHLVARDIEKQREFNKRFP